MASPTATVRLRKELRSIEREPPPHITARPMPSNILRWHFVITGPEGTPYEGGLYMGRLVFPEDYPYRPPAVYMLTPNGRFKTGQKLCLSMSDFHPETWNPLWSVSAVLTGLLSFMLGSEETVGSMKTSDAAKHHMSRVCHQYNRRDKIFKEHFPELVRSEDEVPPPDPAEAGWALAGSTNTDNSNSESLLSLLGWLVALAGLVLAVWKCYLRARSTDTP